MSGGGFFRFRPVPSPPAPAGPGAPTEPDARIERFRRVMLPHLDSAYGFAAYLARHPATAEDVVQEAFLRALRGFDTWQGDNPKGWLLAIVRNCYRDTVAGRHDPLRGAESLEAIDDGAVPLIDEESLEERAARSSDAAVLRQTIDSLPEPFRETLVLRELEELSYKEIAAITNAPLGTVMSRLARARAMLATLFLSSAGESWEARS